MSSGWHWYIVVFSVVNILACLWLILWSARQGDSEKEAMDTLDHVWDENLCERNNPLPRWWLFAFIGSIIFSFIYLAYYPGLGAFRGVGGWTQIDQYEAERARIDAIYEEKFRTLASMDFEALTDHPEAMNIASRIYGANCATCHGSDGRGATGYPNLTDDAWLYGGTPQAISQTISVGRQGVMPPLGAALGETGAAEVVAYVKKLAGLTFDGDLVGPGKTRYDTLCLACHGLEGKGMAALGAPNLIDEAWLYGSSDASLTTSIVEGRMGVMPAHKDLLSADEITLLTAYVVSLSADPPQLAARAE